MNILAVTEKMENLRVLIFCKDFASFKFSNPKKLNQFPLILISD